MKKLLLFPILLLLSYLSHGQRLLSWTPEFATDNTSLVITADCNKGSQGLLNFEGGMSSNVYVHVGVITNLSTGPADWKYVKFPWGTATAAANATAIAPNKYQFTIPNVRTFFNVPAGESIIKVNVIFRNTGGTLKQVNSDGSDMYIPIYTTGQYAVRLNLPPSEPRYVPWLEPINIVGGFAAVQAVSSSPSNLELKYNGTVLNTQSTVSTISSTATFGANTCDQAIVANGLLGATPATDTAKFFITPSTATAALPAGLQDGINYAANNTEVTLVLFAPNHASVNVVGDFSNWQSLCAYQMTKTPDGNRYFLKLTGLTPGQLYKFQYVVDGTIKTTDPYTELVLDPNNDQYIPAANFPNMPAYPTGLTSGIVGTFQTAAPAYTWTTTGYVRPDKKSLVMYEMHLRDFVAANNWQTLADTLNYIKGLGVNAIEVMPFNEFEGNNSWGYNPDFFFAPDKAYGTKNKLKQFIDMAHSKGMAVIMDAVLNHTTGLSPLAQMWWNGATNQPTANSPYLNQTATHPFSVFNDFNHESPATINHTSRFIRHWLTEYKLDGFRWDLSKGFTQKPCGSDVGCWNAYDATRVAIWQRYYDSSQVVSAGSYCILEHLGNDDEEGDLANRGMLLWGKMTSQYNQNTMGYSANSDLNRAFHGNRPFWSQPHLVAYAESHDEERLMYKNLVFGNSSVPTHNVNNLNIALSRMEAMQPFLLLIPGPKMIWQFGELGYDKSIFECENGTVPSPYGSDQCKTNPKPILWNYNTDPARKKIYNVIAGLNRIRALKPNAFITNTIGGNLGNDYKKQLIINHPDLQLVALSNFDVVAQPFSVTFPSVGVWYEYFTNNTFTATGSAQTINMLPGEYRVYTNVSFCTTASPTAPTPVTYCLNATATPLTVTGTNLLWYTTAAGGTGSSTAPTPSTTTIGSTTYYVSQTINGCEGTRAVVVVTVNALPTAPTVSSPVTYCQNVTATALTATGTNLKWYTTSTGGVGNTIAPIPSTATIGTTLYYVSQTIGSCESPRVSITVNVTASTAAPIVVSPVTYCQNVTATPLNATGTGLLWYTASAGGTGSSTAPTPTTTTAGNTTYYVSQTTSCGEGPRAAISVVVNATPTAPTLVNPTITYCQNATATVLTATGTGLLWYTVAAGGTGTATAPTPTTTTAGTTTYYVSQTINGCESPRASIVVNVTATPAAPTVSTLVTYCQNSTAVALTATGTNLLWYTTASGGTGTATAPTPSTSTIGSTTYYVSQTVSTCEGPRAAIVVNIVASTPVPVVTSPVTYCQNSTATTLTATGTGLLWYTSSTGGIGTATAPTPTTTTAGNTIYYVSQTTSCGEGPRAAINVVVNATPAVPTVVNPTISYCQNATAAALTATGTGLLWYTVIAGGTGTATAPTPSTTTAGTTNYYVSQTVNGCEGPRTTVTVNVTATPAAPTVSSPVTYCQNSAAVALTATGTNLLWYNFATGGSSTATAPTPSTTSIGSTTYYVSQSISSCEGPRAPITVNIVASTPAPVVTSPVTYCQNATATILSATGTSLLWYTASSGGTGSSTAPTPSTTSAGTTIYYVSQTTSCGEGPRASISVVVNATPAAPTAISSISFCQNATATALTAIGTNLLWYNVASGGTGSATAPTPSTTTAGTTNYYVSQTINSCEGPRATVTVNVTATPAAPTVISPIAYCQNTTATVLSATGTGLLWYTIASGGIGTATAPIPSTITAGSTTFYVSQTINGCESPRANIIVNVTAIPNAPTISTPVIYCQNSTSVALTATGTNLLWYSTSAGGIGSIAAPTPLTTTIGSTTFYVSQSINTCEGPRASIVVNVVASTPAPAVVSPLTYCQNATATVLSATGTGLLWYTVAAGGTGSTTAPTPSSTTAGTTVYYVSQTTSCGEGARAAISVIVNATPLAPTATSTITYCQNATATALNATGTNLQWYIVSVGGTGSSIAPIPSTTTAGSTTYYVSQTINGCEGPRTSIAVNVTASTTAPTFVSPVTYCQNATAATLSAIGTSLLWYTAASGGTGSATAPTPSTTTAGTTIYYVSQTTSCGEGPRAAISVVVNTTPAAPLTSSSLTYCQTATTITLSATGTSLLWYANASGGSGSANAPTPSIGTAGSTSYYVSQTINGCESPRAISTVTVIATPVSPTVSSSVTYCQNAIATQLSAVGINLLWYSTANGGTANTAAPTPTTNNAGTFTFFVSQTINSCESPRAAIVVNVTASPTAPIITTPVTYCQNGIATALTATGTSLLWYNLATGGSGTATAPTPSTSVAGSTNYYVSQTISCGEGPRAQITAVVNPTPTAPTGLTVTNINNISASLSWNGAAGSFYEVQFKPSSGTVWTTIATGLTTTSTSLTGLTEATSYDWRVNANCNATSNTNFTASTFTTTVKSVVFNNIKNGFGLKVTPNPLRSIAKLDYQLPGSGNVIITLLDNNGQFIGTIFTGSQNAGKFDVDITKFITTLAKGVYLIRLQQNGDGHSIRFIKY